MPANDARACALNSKSRLIAALLLLPFLAQAQATRPEPPELALRDWLVLESIGTYGRTPIHIDAFQAQLAVGAPVEPRAGDHVVAPDGVQKTWTEAGIDDAGQLKNAPPGGYACARVESPRQQVVLLDASGHGMVYVNGEPRGGDPYGNGIVLLPLLLEAGTNHFLFHTGRGGTLQARLYLPETPLLFNLRDATLPDLLIGERQGWGAIPIINASAQTQRGVRLVDANRQILSEFTLPPLSVRKVPFRFDFRPEMTFRPGERELKLFLTSAATDAPGALAVAALRVTVREPGQPMKRTFRSEIDGSVQYYAVNPVQRPASAPADGPAAPALILSLHGASVEATAQAAAYGPKDWAVLVAPTNRRPFGFDWEDWGRIDALEALADASRIYKPDPARVYLTGHSMGGHGTWQLGVMFPDRFAAIGPSAGWSDFWSYTGAPRLPAGDPIAEMLTRASLPSQTRALLRNLAPLGVYILHGDKDDNVPVEQARMLRDALAEFHKDFEIFEQPGAGHWWDVSKDPGADCVDWPPMMEFFRKHTRPAHADVQEIEFSTASPGVSDTCHWATIESQQHPLQVSSIRLRREPVNQITGTTTNVERLAIDWNRDGEVTAELDGQRVSATAAHGLPVTYVRHNETWSIAPPADENTKGPRRYGPFKQAFTNRFVLVYGTKASPEENRLLYAKARYDAETFWYRGNGSVELQPDSEFDADADRNVVLYGNADSNAAWSALLGDSPVQVHAGEVRVGDRKWSGDDLGCLFIRPRSGRPAALVGAVAASGPAGLRALERLPYFLSGVGYPDCTVLSARTLREGLPGVLAAGFFAGDWSIDSGDFAWREESTATRPAP